MSALSCTDVRHTSRRQLSPPDGVSRAAGPLIMQHYHRAHNSSRSDDTPGITTSTFTCGQDSAEDTGVVSDPSYCLPLAKKYSREIESKSLKLASLDIRTKDDSDPESSTSADTLVDRLISPTFSARLDHYSKYYPAHFLDFDSDFETEGSYPVTQAAPGATSCHYASNAATQWLPRRTPVAPYSAPRPTHAIVGPATTLYPTLASLTGTFGHPAATKDAFCCGGWIGDFLVAGVVPAHVQKLRLMPSGTTDAMPAQFVTISR
ncbi:hypothetical protein CERSUDRAFT_92809 [Gelatoporia subvermispora B]|uniref:Uncharacterized protein n=1 Tax=Ceriporiopsis subvermispora (strain B) TaxID=914234 RepID=M2RJX6_CERS8|nr:hypothetical protein CERSUDRAFT_92809 [Gelatoporia subvermispora B]